MSGAITDVTGIRVGHYTDRENGTGCTVVLCEEGATASVDVRGGSPGTRETDLLLPDRHVQKVHAILLTGGSAFGLEAAGGVMRYLAERGKGHQTSVVRVPIVPAAVIFDLNVGRSTVWPTADWAFQACTIASDGPVAEGSVGAGTGATVGKALGIAQSTKGGVGTCSETLPIGATVAALVVVNAFGDVVDPSTGQIIAGARRPEGGFAGCSDLLKQGVYRRTPAPGSTIIGVVATDLPLSKGQAHRVAQMAHDGLARATRPSHTLYDGDTLFVLASPGANAEAAGTTVGPDEVNAIGVAAAEMVAEAVLRGVRRAETLFGIPSAREIGSL